jgi:hypothetical protein
MSDYTGAIWPARAPEPSQAEIYDHHMGAYPNPDIDVAPAVLNPRCPVMPDHPPYTPPAMTMSRLYRIQMDIDNGRFGEPALLMCGSAVMPNDVQALVNEVLRLRGELK